MGKINLCIACESFKSVNGNAPAGKKCLGQCEKTDEYLYVAIYKCEYKKPPFTKEEHIKKHKELHEQLDMLVADWIIETGNLLSNVTILELMQWSHQQTLNPTDRLGNVEG